MISNQLDKINFSIYEIKMYNKKYIFNRKTEEYKIFDQMTYEEWKLYLKNMAKKGVIVEYNEEKDLYIIS